MAEPEEITLRDLFAVASLHARLLAVAGAHADPSNLNAANIWHDADECMKARDMQIVPPGHPKTNGSSDAEV